MFQTQCLDITPQLYWWANGVLQRDTQTNNWVCEGQASSLGIYNWDRCSSFEILCDCAAYEGGTGTKTLPGMGGDVKVKLCETLPSSQKLQSICRVSFFFSITVVQASSATDLLCRNTAQSLGCLSAWGWEQSCQERKRICWFKGGERGTYCHSQVVRQQICCPDLMLLCRWAPGQSSMLEKIRQGICGGQQATHCEGLQHIHERGKLPWCMRCKVQLPHEFTEGVPLPVRTNHHVRPCECMVAQLPWL